MKKIVLSLFFMLFVLYSWSQTAEYYGGCGNETAWGIACSENSIYTFGTTKSYTYGGQLYLVRSELNGNNIWAKTYDNIAVNSNLLNIAVINNNNIVIVNGRQSVICFDSNGNVNWAKQFASSIFLRTVTKYQNDIIVAGYMPTDIYGSDHSIVLIKMDT
ncbi:MAG: hypothetical protein WCL06_15040, partial [Bacteroidota bacterium]